MADTENDAADGTLLKTAGDSLQGKTDGGTVNNSERIDFQQNQATVGKQYIFVGQQGSESTEPVEELPEDLPKPLPPSLHPFRDPRHVDLLADLANQRVLVLSSYQEKAAYAAAHALVFDERFQDRSKRALFPGRKRDKERSDFDLLAVAQEDVLGGRPQVLLIEINSWCTLLDSALNLGWGSVAQIKKRLESYSSYLILVIDEDLLRNETSTARIKQALPFFTVSHLRYLLTKNYPERAGEIEQQLLSSIARLPVAIELRELYQRVADRLGKGADSLEAFLRELEQVRDLPVAAQKERLQPVRVEEVFREGSEIHRAAAFVATYLPDLSQRDFDRLVKLLLSEENASTSDAGGTGQVEAIAPRWLERWHRSADQVFRDCHLRTATSGNGSWSIDFGEAYLRRELRTHMEQQSPFYVRRQCQRLQDSGVLFALDLSPTAVEGLVRLFVDRAQIDPSEFGSVWLIGLVLGLQIQVGGQPPDGSSEVRLAWLFKQIVAEARLRKLFHERLALLVREMLEREALRPMVREFFEFLLATREHGALLEVVLELAERLRFAPHFDALYWMERLLNQGIKEVKERTARSLVRLARRSGPRIYEFLAAIRRWLPDEERPSDSFSDSNRVALDFPFSFCLDVAGTLSPEYFGKWPSRHQLFYALPADPDEARAEIGRAVQWILDPRGAASEKVDAKEAMRTSEVVRLESVGDLLEHWAWVLEGGTESGAQEGRELFAVVLEEIGRRIGERERAWLLRGWHRRRDGYLREAAGGAGYRDARRFSLVARRDKLDQLRVRMASLPVGQEVTASEVKIERETKS